MRWFALLCVLSVLAVGAVPAQDCGLGTPSLKSPNALGDEDFRATVDWRWWDGSNDTFAFLAEYGVTDRLDLGAGYVTFDNLGEPPIAGALRASDLHGPAVWLKYVGREVEGNRWGWSVAPGVEFLTMEGTNTAIGATAGGDETVFSLEVPIGIPDGDVLWMVTPKLATFPDTAPVTGPIGIQLPAEIDSFGTVVGLGLGVVAPIGTGDNSIDPDTNDPTVQLLFGAGARRALHVADESYLDLFVTNASGPTTATSLIAAPDQSVGFGARVSVCW
jgi:hypothetical protein